MNASLVSNVRDWLAFGFVCMNGGRGSGSTENELMNIKIWFLLLLCLCFRFRFSHTSVLLTPPWRVSWVIACLETESIVLDVVVPPLPQLRSWATAKERTTPEGFDNSQVEVSQAISYTHSISCKTLFRARKWAACMNNSALFSKIIFQAIYCLEEE